MKHYKKILSGLSVLILSLIMTSGIVFADSEVPAITSLTFYGNVDVSGSSNPDEYYIKARIDDWESQPVVIGEFKTYMFHGLFVYPPKEYIGKTKTFCLIHSKEINHPIGSLLNQRMIKSMNKANFIIL